MEKFQKHRLTDAAESALRKKIKKTLVKHTVICSML